MKKIIIIGMCVALWLMCLTTAVFADVDLYQSIDTNGGDLDGSWWIDTDGGEAEITINGVKPFGTYYYSTNTFKEGSSGLSMDSVLWNLAKVFMKYDYMDKSYEPIPFDGLDYYQQMFRYVMEQTFISKQEYVYRESMMLNQIEQLNLRLLTLESFFNETELCAKGLAVAVQENVSRYSCDGINYYNKYGEFIGIEKTLDSVEKVIEEPVKDINITELSLSKYEKLCNELPTNNKYCNVVGMFNKTIGGI